MTELQKIGRELSVWVPPVVREYTVPRTTTSTTRGWRHVRTETRYVLPQGWREDPVALMGGRFFTTVPGVRVVNGYREVWYFIAASIPSYWVEVYEPVVRENSGLTYETVREVLAEGYWSSQVGASTWVHGAHSVQEAPRAWEMTFVLPTRPDGVVVGPAAAGTELAGGDARTRIKQGFFVSGGDVSLWMPEGSTTPVEELGQIPAWSPEAVFEMRSDGINVTWLVDGAPVARTALLGGDDFVMAAALYGAFDVVADATFIPLEGGTAHLLATPVVSFNGNERIRAFVTPALYAHSYPALITDRRIPYVRAADESASGVVHVTDSRRPRVVSYGLAGTSGNAGFSATPFVAAHGYDAGFAALYAMPVVRLAESTGPKHEDSGAVRTAVATSIMPGAILVGGGGIVTGITGSVVRAHKVAERLRMRSGLSASRLVQMVMRERFKADDRVFTGQLVDVGVYEVMSGGHTMLAGLLINADLREVLAITDEADLSRIIGRELLEQIGVEAGASAQAIKEALMRELLGVTVIKDLGAPTAVWSVSETGDDDEESTSYENFPFTGFADIGGRYFGANESGLYRLGGDTDDGAPINAHVDFGDRDFQSAALKSIPNAYISTNAAKPLVMRVESPQGVFEYTTRRADPFMRTQRFDLGKGLRAHFFKLQLANKDGVDFEFDDIEFLVQESTRRI